jgi:sterol 14alpha-demethylase
VHKPTPPMVSGALPLVGHALAFAKDRTALFERGYREHGPLFGLRLFGQSVAVLVGPQHHRTFFGETDKSLDMEKPYKFLQAIFGEVAFLASHETYMQQRPVLHAPFKRSKTADYLRIMQREVQLWLDSLADDGAMELTLEMNGLVQRVAGYALMGEKFQESVGNEFWELYEDLSKAMDPILPHNLPLPKFRRRDRAKARMIEILQPVIDERRKHPEQYSDFLQDIINTPLADGTAISDDAIIGIILALNFAGHETTAGQAAWTVIQILQHPAYRALVENEIAENLPLGTVIDGPAMGKMRHIEWAIRETERTHPSADMQMRYATEDLELNGYVIPAGWLVQTAAMVAHQLPQLFDEPQKYDPLRYAPGRQEDRRDRFALIGFGGGTHKCAGMNFANNEMFVICALLFQQFDLELITTDPQILYGAGATKPTETWIRYRRQEIGERSLGAAERLG